MIQVLTQHPVREGMRDPPAEKEILEGMSDLKGNTGPHILDNLYDLFATAWME